MGVVHEICRAPKTTHHGCGHLRQCTTECHLRLPAAPLSADEQNNQKVSTVQRPLHSAVSLACRYKGRSSQSARSDRNWKGMWPWVETRQRAPSFTQPVSPVLRGVFSRAGLRWKRCLCREQWNRGLERCLLRRTASSAFVGSFLVFPGKGSPSFSKIPV